MLAVGFEPTTSLSLGGDFYKYTWAVYLLSIYLWALLNSQTIQFLSLGAVRFPEMLKLTVKLQFPLKMPKTIEVWYSVDAYGDFCQQKHFVCIPKFHNMHGIEIRCCVWIHKILPIWPLSNILLTSSVFFTITTKNYGNHSHKHKNVHT